MCINAAYPVVHGNSHWGWSTSDHRLDHVNLRQIPLADHIHDQVTGAICSLERSLVRAYNKYEQKLWSLSGAVPHYSRETSVKVHSYVSAPLGIVNCSYAYLVNDVEILVQPDIAGINWDTVVNDKILHFPVDFKAECSLSIQVEV